MTRARPVHEHTAAGAARRTALALAVFAALVYVVTGGGRVVASDEVAMLDLSRAMLRGHLWVPAGATLRGPDGRDYTKNAAGQAVLALPLVAIGEAGAAAAHLPPARATLAVRFVASFLNALVTAVLLALLYLGARALGAGAGAALAGALMLGFATPVWVYAKSFLAEPIEGLGILAAVLGASLAGEKRFGLPRGERLAAFGVFLAVSVKLSMLPLVLGALVPLFASPRRTWVAPAIGLALALAGHAVYNVARFGTPLETGYGAQATPAAYTTPILVGLYGLLLSSGKGLVWFAPPVWLVPAGVRAMLRTRSDEPSWLARAGLTSAPGRAAWGTLGATAAALLLYARFQHWAGDGSFGPRYLVPLLPALGLCVVAALASGSSGTRRVARLACVLGVIVQIGGVGIYFGAQMRDAGDYPYTRSLEHPRFMSDSHWNPRFSPIAGHWRMLARNASEHLRGRPPRLGIGQEGGERDARTGVAPADQTALLHAIDVWWLYLADARLGGPAPAFAAALLALLAFGAARALARARAAEAGPA